MKKIYFVLLLLIFGLFILLYKYPYLLKGIKNIYLQGHKTSYISDFIHYPKRVIPNNPEKIWEWPLHSAYNQSRLSEKAQQINKRLGTSAFLVIKNDSILFEKYFNGYHRDSLSNSFSMAKSITMSLVFKAIQDGFIKSLDQKVKDFIPGIQGKYADSLTIKHLAMMSSGSNWVENYYNPFNITAESYFTEDLENLITEKVRFDNPPGKKWYYSSGDTQLLGIILRKATGKTLAEYLSESFWKPMGMRKHAFWNLDRENGMEKAFCCVNSNARDFSKFGRLYLHQGNWNGQQLLDSVWIQAATRPYFKEMPHYGLQWWLFEHNGVKGYAMRGHLGQYVIVIPGEHIIITRLGQKKDPSQPGRFSNDFWIYLEEGLRIAREN